MSISEQNSLIGRDLHFGYEADLDVLCGVSMSFVAGSFTVILGPNGSGKTTLLRLLSGALPPRSGEVLLGEKDLAAWERGELARTVAVVPQEVDVAFPFTVEEVVLMGRAPHLGRIPFEGKQDLEMAREAMQQASVMDLRGRNFLTCSGGEKQRVLLARALAQDPRILLLDEPGAHLDLHHQVALYRCLNHLNRIRGLTVVIVSHDWNLPAQFCSTAILLSNGRIVASGPIASVMNEEQIEAVYRTRVRVGRDPQSGQLFVIPLANVEEEENRNE